MLIAQTYNEKSQSIMVSGNAVLPAQYAQSTYKNLGLFDTIDAGIQIASMIPLLIIIMIMSSMMGLTN